MSGKRTPLFSRHQELGARIIDFGGWDMPVQYKTGIIKEHKAVRSAVGLFDVCHMGEAWLRGSGAEAAVQNVITNDVSKLSDGSALYTVMCYPHGGIVDDCIVYRKRADEFLIILNASNVAKDLAWLREHAGQDLSVEDASEDTALIAVQGPEAVAVADALSDSALAEIPRFHFADAKLAGVSCMVARTGYTGEDGFELACSAADAVQVWDALLEAGGAPIGLGARDTLRLEARLSLYGNDIDDTTNPYEAALGWVVKLDAGPFIGSDVLTRVKAEGRSRKLVGFVINERKIARQGYEIVDRSRAQSEQTLGLVTSGTRAISVEGSIGLGYIPVEHAKVGDTITVDCRGTDVPATVVKGPFYKR